MRTNIFDLLKFGLRTDTSTLSHAFTARNALFHWLEVRLAGGTMTDTHSTVTINLAPLVLWSIENSIHFCMNIEYTTSSYADNCRGTTELYVALHRPGAIDQSPRCRSWKLPLGHPRSRALRHHYGFFTHAYIKSFYWLQVAHPESDGPRISVSKILSPPNSHLFGLPKNLNPRLPTFSDHPNQSFDGRDKLERRTSISYRFLHNSKYAGFFKSRFEKKSSYWSLWFQTFKNMIADCVLFVVQNFETG